MESGRLFQGTERELWYFLPQCATKVFLFTPHIRRRDGMLLGQQHPQEKVSCPDLFNLALFLPLSSFPEQETQLWIAHPNQLRFVIRVKTTTHNLSHNFVRNSTTLFESNPVLQNSAFRFPHWCALLYSNAFLSTLLFFFLIQGLGQRWLEAPSARIHL